LTKHQLNEEKKIVFACVVECHFEFKNVAELRMKQEIKLPVLEQR
jgi:hypothetical protein